MVDLVLEAAGEQAGAGDLDRPPFSSRPVTVAVSGRATSAASPRIDRHPSSDSSSTRSATSGRCSTGFATTPRCSTPSSSGQSYTKTRSVRPTWLAARPTPSAAYMLANRSATSARKSSSKTSTGSATCRSTSSPTWTIGSALWLVRHGVRLEGLGRQLSVCAARRRTPTSPASHFSSIRPTRHTSSATTQARTNSPTIANPTLLRSSPATHATGPDMMPSLPARIDTTSIVPMTSATATDSAVTVML